MQLAPNTLLQGRYRVQDLIAQGGMGAVYRALDTRLGHTVALKQTLMTDPQLRAAFEREARLLASLQHSALPVVSDHFAEADGEFLVMQYIAGPDLADELQRRGAPFTSTEVLPWADRLLDALDYLHTQAPPIIHRDIKPQNLKLTPRGEPILLDFGLAKGVAGDPQSIVGYTPRYAPLEQIRGSGTEPRSDLYSFAATLYELLTDQAPPDALTRAAAAVSSAPDPLIPAHALNPAVPTALSTLLTSTLALDIERRPPTAAALRTAIRDLHRPTPSSAGVTTVALGAPATPQLQAQRPAPAPPVPTPLPAQVGTQSSRGVLALLFGMAVLALLGIGAFGLVVNSLLTPTNDGGAGVATPVPVATSAPEPVQAASGANVDPAQPTAGADTVINPVGARLGGTRAEPFPPDTPVRLGDWEIRLLDEQIRGAEAWERMQAANRFNDPPPEGMEYLILRLDLRTTFSGDDTRQLYPELVGDRRVESASTGVAPEPRLVPELAGNSRSEGYVAFLVGVGEENLLLKVDQLLGRDELEPVFLALSAGNALPDDPALAALIPNRVGGSHREPAAIGATATMEDWEVTVREVVRGAEALERLIAEYADVNRPVDGREYALAYLTVRYIGPGERVRHVNRSNVLSVLTDDPATPPTTIAAPQVYLLPYPELDHWVYPGAVVEGWAVIEVPVGNPNVALVFLGSIFGNDPENTRYFALQE
jgi:hypothetical protein